MGSAVSAVTNTVKNVGNAASGAVGNIQKGAQQFGKGAQQLGSGDLKGLQTMGGAVVNTPANLYGNMNDITRAGIDHVFSPLAGTPLYGLTAGNLKGGIGSLEGVVRGNIAGIQDLPTDIGAGVQHGLNQIGGAAQDLLDGLGGALGGGGGGAGGGVSAPGYYKDLAEKQAQYGMNLPDQFQEFTGDRFAAPSDRTTEAESAIYNNNANSQQAAFDRASALMTAGSQYNPQGPQATEYKSVYTRNPLNFAGRDYFSANQGLQGPVNYQQGKTLRESMKDFRDPYTDSVVNQTIKDMDRARKITGNQISGDAARAGAFGGSREALMQAENNRNFADRTAAAVGQLRSQGFQKAADLAQQENLQRLGLTAQDVQQMRGLQSQGNLQGQNLTAQSANQAQQLGATAFNQAANRDLQAQLAAQGLGAASYENQQKNALTDAYNQGSFGQQALNTNLQAAQLTGSLGNQMDDQIRQQLFDQRNMGLAQDFRNQQPLDFAYQQYLDERNFPTQYLNNLQQSGGLTQSLISGPEAQKNPYSGLLSGAGMGLATYGTLAPLIGAGALPAALGMGALGLLGG